MTNSFTELRSRASSVRSTSALQWWVFLFLHGKTHDPPIHLLVLYPPFQPSVSIHSFCVCPQRDYIIKWHDYSLYIQPAHLQWLQWTTHRGPLFPSVTLLWKNLPFAREGNSVETRTLHLTLLKFVQVGKLQFSGKFPSYRFIHSPPLQRVCASQTLCS